MDEATPSMEADQEISSVFLRTPTPESIANLEIRRKSSTPALTNRVPPPRNEEEWVEFIDNYIRYGFVTQSDLFRPPDAESIDSQRLSNGAATPDIQTPMQETFAHFPNESTLSNALHIEEQTKSDTMVILPPIEESTLALSSEQPPRRPSLDHVGSDETAKISHAMSTCSTGSMSGSWDRGLGESRREEAHRVQQFYEQNGFMCAPAQLPADTKKRLRAIRRLGFDRKDGSSNKRTMLDRYTRLLTSILKAKMSTVTILGAEAQLFPSEVGLGIESLGHDLGFCTHTALSTEMPLVVENADEDWRFANHPMVQSGVIKSYCGAPLRQGKHSAIIGTLCVIDDKPRPDFLTDAKDIVKELAACVSNELELLAKAEEQRLSQRMHNVALQFSQQWLQNSSSCTRIVSPRKAKRMNRQRSIQVGIAITEDGAGVPEEISIYDEACQVVAQTIGATCTIIDTSALHISYPEAEAQSASTQGPSLQRPRAPGRGDTWKEESSKSISPGGTGEIVLSPIDELSDREPAEDHTIGHSQPKVYHLPKKSALSAGSRLKDERMLRSGVLGCSHTELSLPEDLAEVLLATIVYNLKTRKIWYEAPSPGSVEDSEEEFIKPLMGEHSAALVLPVFDYRSQVPFLFVACSSADIFAFDSAALAFVESICSTVLASVLRNQLAAIDEAQRSFATMANHELKTPLHQILMCANDLRETLEVGMDENRTPSLQEKEEMFKLCDVILNGAERTQSILNAVVDYHADIGNPAEKQLFSNVSNADSGEELEDILAEALHDAVEQEKLKRAALGQDLSLVETIVEIVPRGTGWRIARDCDAIKKVLENILVNAYHATEEGYVLVTCEDISDTAQLTNVHDDTTPTVRIRIKDTGKGMAKNFYESGEIFEPFSKVDKFSPGAGLGVTLAKRTIDQMGGSICYESIPGKGTLVTIDVPLHIQVQRKDDNDTTCGSNLTTAQCGLIGFDATSPFGVQVVGDFLKRKLHHRNVNVCLVEDASIVIIEERALNEEVVKRMQDLVQLHDVDTIILGSASSKRRWRSNPPFLDSERIVPVRWLFRPVNPALMRQILRKGQSSVSSDHERRRSSTWATYPSRASLASAFVNRERPSSSSFSAESVSDVVDGTSIQAAIETVEAVTEAETVSPIPQLMAQDLENGMQVLKRCISASDLKVLIVEDNAINRQVLARMIKKLGHPYEEAEDGVVGVEKYKTFCPSLGFGAAAQIRAYEAKLKLPKAPILVVTAIKDDAAIARGKNECQIDDWLLKPLGIKVLTEKIRRLYDIKN